MALTVNGNTISKVTLNAGPLGLYGVVGSPTIANNILSNPTSDNYVKLSKYPNLAGANNWEFGIKIKRTGTSDTRLLGFCSGARNGFNCSCNSSKLWFEVGSAGGWIFGLAGKTILELNSWYFVRFLFTGTQYQAYLSTDGINWVQEISKDSTTKTVNSSATYTCFGTDKRFTPSGFSGDIDFNNTYIKTNGEYVFKGWGREIDYVSKDGILIWTNPNL